MTATVSHPMDFGTYLEETELLNVWCFDSLEFSHDYELLLKEIELGQVVLVSDGSYDPRTKRDAAAWVLEGTQTKLHITGKIVTLGGHNDQSAYRSELAGMLSAITVINALTAYHNLTGTATLLSNCETGLHKAFNISKPAKLQDSCHDIIRALQHELTRTQMCWKGKHIKGHQDDSVPFKELDRPSQLNVIVDQMAKNHLSDTAMLYNDDTVRSTAWTIHVGSKVLIHDIDRTLYDLVHTPIVREYWKGKARINDDNFTSVHWSRLGQAMNKMKLARRLFCSKHMSGMCGVGKFQRIWKTKETSSCPHCDQYEDALHVWKCQADTVEEVWSTSIQNLQKHLRKLDTDPELITAITDYLDSWQHDTLLTPIEDIKYRRMLELQDTIGVRQFFEGWVHQDWEKLQEQYYIATTSRRSSKRWTIAFITKLWDVAWDLWDFRNAVYHHKQNFALREDTSALDKKIRGLFHNLALTGLLTKDMHLTTISLPRLLLFPRSDKVEWLEQATLALAQAKKRNFDISRSRIEQHRRHQAMITSMHRNLRNWLVPLSG